MLDDNFVYCVLDGLWQNGDDLITKTERWAENTSFEESDSDAVCRIMSSFLNRLQAINADYNISEEKRAEALGNIIGTAKLGLTELIELDEVQEVSDAVTEAVCDLAMVKLAGLKAVQYLLNYVKVQKDLLLETGNIQHQDIIRIGVVLDMLYGFDKPARTNQKQLDKLSEEFIDLFIGLYFSIKECVDSKEVIDSAKEQKQKNIITSWSERLSSGLIVLKSGINGI